MASTYAPESSRPSTRAPAPVLAAETDAFRNAPPGEAAAADQEALAKLQEKQLRERLESELAKARVADTQVSDAWRRILRLTKTEELRREVEVLSQEYERDVERRDAAIADRVRALAALEAQMLFAAREHARALDALIEAQDARPLLLEREYRRDLAALQADFAAERVDATTRLRAFKTEMQHVAKALREDEEARVAGAAAEFEQTREALKRRALERMHVLQSDMDAVIEGYEKRFEEAHVAYLAATDARTQEYKALSERGQHDQAMNERQQRALKRLNKLLHLWRSKHGQNVAEAEERNESLQGEKESVAGHLERLKRDMTASRAAHLARMKALSASAADAKARLADATATAQRILGAAEALRAMEAASEKVAPFAAAAGALPGQALGAGGAAVGALRAATGAATGTSLGAPAGVDLSASLLRGEPLPPPPTLAATAAAVAAEGLPLAPDAAAPGTGAALAEAEALHNFYGRLNKALLESLALERSRDALRAEHAELQLVLQQVLDGTSVTPSAVDGPNALVIVNGRVAPGGAERRAPPPPVRLGGRPHVGDAALIANTMALHAHGGARRA